MLCINNEHIDPYFNLAAEEYLLKNFSENIFMLWQNEPSVILGKHQNAFAEIDVDFAQLHNLKIARRFSGGGTVFHDLGNLNLTFIETSNNINFDRFTDRILDLLANIGIEASADKRRAINIDGLKISGSAQCIHKNRAMFHATLLFSSDLSILTKTLEGDENTEKGIDKRLQVKSVKSPVTNIAEHISNVNLNDFKHYIINYFISSNGNNVLYSFNNKDLGSIEQLRQDKYIRPEWNFEARMIKQLK